MEKKDWLHSAYWLLLGLAAAIKKRMRLQKWNTTDFRTANRCVSMPITTTVTMLVQINGRFLTDDTRHGIVFKDGSNGHKSLFMGYATPKAFYEAPERGRWYAGRKHDDG